MYRTISTTFWILLSFLAFCEAVEFNDCGSTIGKFSTVTLSGCDMSQPVCDLVRDTNVTIAIDFTTGKDISHVSAVVHGIIMDVPIPFPLPMADACQNTDSGITCPLTQGGPYHYKATLPVLKAYPKLSVQVKWELQDENKEDIVCVIIPTKIK